MEAVTEVKSNVPAHMPQGAWGAKNVEMTDVIIPRLLMMQGSSEFVKKRKAAFGDIVDSLTVEVLGNPEEPVEIIPFFVCPKYWVVQEKVGTNWEFRSKVPYGPANANWRYEGLDAKGNPIQNVLHMDFFVMVAGKLGEFPYQLSFRKTGLKTAKRLITHFSKCEMKNVPAARTVFALGGEEDSKDGQTFMVMTLTEKRQATDEELAAAWKWFQQVSQAPTSIQVHEGDDEIGEAPVKPVEASQNAEPVDGEAIPF